MVFLAPLASWREAGLKGIDLAEPQRAQRKIKTIKYSFLGVLGVLGERQD